MSIDPSIPLQTQNFDMLGMIDRGSQLAQFYAQQRTDKELNRIYNESQGDLGQMLELGKQSKLARFVMPHLKAQQATQSKALQDQMKAEADIAKTSSEAYKNNQQGAGFGVDNSQKRLGAINGAITQGAMTGDKTQVLLGLDGLRRTGMISDDDYTNFSAKLNLMTPDDIKQWGQGVILSSAKDPSSYFYQTANNAADNAQSDINNQRTTQASIYSTDKNYDLGQSKLQQDQHQFDAKLEYQRQQDEIKNRQGEVKEFGGKAYIVYKDGTYRPALDANGQHISSTKGDTSAKIKIAETEGNNDQLNQTIQTLEKAKQLSQQGIYDGSFSGARSDIMGMFGGTEESRRTQEYNNIVMNNALSSLKSIFGGNPTEGERAILLKIQASSDYPPQVREKILDEAINAAKLKIASNNKQIGIMGGSSQPQQKTVNAAHVQSFFD